MFGPPHSFDDLPGRTARVYLLIGFVWIIGSDLVITTVNDTGTDLFALNTAKGLGFVTVTAAILYRLLSWWVERASTASDEAALAQRRFEALVEGSADLIVVLDEDGRVTYASPSLQRVAEISPESALGFPARDLIHPDDREAANAYLADVRDGADIGDPLTVRLLTPQGRWRDLEVVARDLRHDPAVGGVVVHGRDMTQRRQIESRLAHAMHHDLLTGVANQSRFEVELRDVALAADAQERGLIVLVVDVQGFRDVNAMVGRAGGDRVLNEVVARIRTAVDPLALGRLGADTFGLGLLSSSTDGDAVIQADVAATALHEILGDPFDIGGKRLRLGAAVGGAVVTGPGSCDRAQLLAETNLRDAKSHPDRTVVCQLSADDRSRLSGAELASSMHEALERGELRLHFQVQYELTSGEVVGSEALIRWQHPTEGLLGPRSFLREAMRANLVPLITGFALREAATQAEGWRRAGIDVPVSVNLSPDDLRRHSIVDEVLEAIDTGGAEPSSIRLEVTEQTLLADPDRTLKAMRTLRDLGIGFSIDDFGTGYSSLLHLRNLPVDELKIDQSFVGDMTSSAVDDSIVTAVIELGQRLGLTVLAEGIEDSETYRMLTERGCDRGQGYLMARPVPADEVDFEPFALVGSGAPATGQASGQRISPGR